MEIFDNLAESYDGWYTTAKGSFVDKVETGPAFSLFPVKEGMTVLDVGCGTGNFTLKLAQMGCRVTGVDISDSMLEIAREKTSASGLKARYHRMDIYKLDFQVK